MGFSSPFIGIPIYVYSYRLLSLERRDPRDWPVVAVAPLLRIPVWTEDQDFFGSKIVMWYGVSTDSENPKQTQEKLREDERELRRITDAIPQAIVVLDPSGTPLYANQATLDYTGLTEGCVRPELS